MLIDCCRVPVFAHIWARYDNYLGNNVFWSRRTILVLLGGDPALAHTTLERRNQHASFVYSPRKELTLLVYLICDRRLRYSQPNPGWRKAEEKK